MEMTKIKTEKLDRENQGLKDRLENCRYSNAKLKMDVNSLQLKVRAIETEKDRMVIKLDADERKIKNLRKRIKEVNTKNTRYRSPGYFERKAFDNEHSVYNINNGYKYFTPCKTRESAFLARKGRRGTSAGIAGRLISNFKNDRQQRRLSVSSAHGPLHSRRSPSPPAKMNLLSKHEQDCESNPPSMLGGSHSGQPKRIRGGEKIVKKCAQEVKRIRGGGKVVKVLSPMKLRLQRQVSGDRRPPLCKSSTLNIIQPTESQYEYSSNSTSPVSPETPEKQNGKQSCLSLQMNSFEESDVQELAVCSMRVSSPLPLKKSFLTKSLLKFEQAKLDKKVKKQLPQGSLDSGRVEADMMYAKAQMDIIQSMGVLEKYEEKLSEPIKTKVEDTLELYGKEGPLKCLLEIPRAAPMRLLSKMFSSSHLDKPTDRHVVLCMKSLMIFSDCTYNDLVECWQLKKGEVTLLNTGKESLVFCLRRESDGAIWQFFPATLKCKLSWLKIIAKIMKLL